MASTSADDPAPVHVPRPAVGERNWLGSLKTPGEKYPLEPRKLKKSDVFTYLGAGIGVLLTVLALTFYTGIFGKNLTKKKPSHSAMSHETQYS
ncbi:hypothetical protein KIN20_034446 [Parelaphostrongylus tenuis]|uniref:Uncharacterized protein n=1 Tax=Parelaphostrongylus tenuis TaxID=148309 RepID=A0AAD5RA81_PARTN|nr:hypothetical protein KIN20_034446 [Parelaphostrongylus tenuis]